ncbi:MMPL family transporter [Rheinheimera sp. UJ51]|uniref:efflux RND transporter permease subunit n=1 Tax=Rheinheimera sp. UJ51 TaxID=2892446 RepID=UPI001E62CA0E|nr:MMPL family transporter [Rheinheimera sp. UJ51]MCC5450621.1 MMPL family transporter [Rheinheimera sp. UJ51]
MTPSRPFVLRHPWSVLSALLLIIALFSAGLNQLYFRGDYRIFFGPDNPQLQAFEQMQQEFNKSDNVLIGIAPKDRNVFQADVLQLVQDFTNAAWQTPYSIRIDSISNFQHTEAEDDDLRVQDLVSAERTLDDAELARIRDIALNEPIIRDRLIAADGAVTAINITVQLPEPTGQAQVDEIWSAVMALTDQFAAQYPDVEFYHTGIIAMNYAFASEAEADVKRLVPMMLLVIALMLAWLFRSFYASLVTIIILIVSVVSTLGIAGWLGIFMSTATVNVPTILMTLAVADSVHLLAGMQFAMSEGKSKQQAIKYSLERNWLPVVITSVTTAIGFLTLNFSEVPILRDLGNLTAIGVVLACIFSLTLLPLLMNALPFHEPDHVESGLNAMDKLALFVIRWQRPIMFGFIAITIVCSGLLTLNKVNDEPNEYFSTSTSFRQSNDFLEENLSGFTLMDFEVKGDGEGAVYQPEMLLAVAQFSDWLVEQPEVMHVNTFTDILKKLNRNMHQDDPAYYRLPHSTEEAAQYILLYEMSLPFGLDLNNQLNIDKSATRLSATLYNLGSKELIALEERALAYFAEQWPEYQLSAASAALMFAHIGERNMASMLKTLPAALVLISLLLLFTLRSWRLGLISLLTNLVPAIIGFGLWGLLVGEVNLALSVVAGMSLGIIVDDTVHFLTKYRYARKEGQDNEQAVRFAFHSVGRALWITTLVLVSGFAVLMLSSFRLNFDMGLLTSSIILVALIIDLLFLPAVLLQVGKFGRAKHAK